VIASGAKGLTALVVVSLIEQGVLDLSTTARSPLRDDLPDEDDDSMDLNDYLLSVPMQELADTEEYLAVLDGAGPGLRAGSA
jgi:hypothetical protein